MLALISSAGTALADFNGRVIGVTDGDTLKVLRHGREVKIRIAGIDAPESRQAWGKQSKTHLSSMLFGRDVHVEERNADRYGRTLARILINGRDAGLRQVEAGMAWHYRQYRRTQPREEALRYAAAEAQARHRHAGLWQEARPVPPWAWRHRH